MSTSNSQAKSQADAVGRRAIAWARQSSKGPSEGSCADPLAVIAAFAAKRDFSIVDQVILDGVSGSSQRVHDEVDALLQRKGDRDDFDAIIVHDLSRLTRGGVKAGNHLEYQVAKAGIDLLAAHGENPAPGPRQRLRRPLLVLSAYGPPESRSSRPRAFRWRSPAAR